MKYIVNVRKFDGVRAQSTKTIEQRLGKRTALPEVDVFTPSKLELFGSRMDGFAVERTPSEDFLEVLARIQAVRLRYKIKVRESRCPERDLYLCMYTQYMGTKTIGLRDDAYERLQARKREGESFTELVNRLLDESQPDWREGFGTLSVEEGDELEQFVEESRSSMSAGIEQRQQEVIDELSNGEENADETA